MTTETIEPTKTKKNQGVPHDCLCGCGAVIETKATFVPGHDSKLKSQVIGILKASTGEDGLPTVKLSQEKSLSKAQKEALPTLFKGRFAENM